MYPGSRGRFAVVTRIAMALVGLLVLSGCEFNGIYSLPLPGSPVDKDHSIEVTAEFRDVVNIVPRSPVKVDDVTVGEVTEVEREGWNALVTMRIRDDVVLPDNVTAQIKQVSLLGEKYISIEQPAGRASDDTLSDEDHLGMSSTSRSPEVEEVLGALSMLLSGGGVAQISTITTELNDLMTGREERLRSVLGNIEEFVGTIDQQKGDVIRALEAVNRLSATVNRDRQVIADALDVTGPAVATLRSQHEQLIELLASLERLGEVGTRVITRTKDDLLESLRQLRPILNRLNETGQTLVPALSLLASYPFPEAARNSVQGDYANASAVFEIRLDQLFDAASLGPIIPDPNEVLAQVRRCLASGSLTSQACVAVLDNAFRLARLLEECAKPANQSNLICRIVNSVPTGQAGGLELPDLSGILGKEWIGGQRASGDALASLGVMELDDAVIAAYTNGAETVVPGGLAVFGGGR